MSEINVVPYIDVMLVLLVIFMITTPLLTQGIKIELPKAKSKVINAKDQVPIILSVDASGKYYLNVADKPELPMTAQQIALRVAAELKIAKQDKVSRPVLVKGDSEVDYGKVVQAMVLLQKSGAKEVGLMTKPPAETN